MDLGISKNVAPLLADVKAFIDNEVMPLEQKYLDEIAVGDRWSHTAR